MSNCSNFIRTLRWILIVFLSINLISCSKDPVVSEVYIDEELQELFDRFVQEGIRRNVVIDFSQIPVEGFLNRDLSASVTAQCQHDSGRPDRVVVNLDYWNRSSAIQREFLVFHELGHCYLKRAHLDLKDSQGTCMSIMHSGASVCYNAYNELTRDRYLDELFHPN